MYSFGPYKLQRYTPTILEFECNFPTHFHHFFFCCHTSIRATYFCDDRKTTTSKHNLEDLQLEGNKKVHVLLGRSILCLMAPFGKRHLLLHAKSHCLKDPRPMVELFPKVDHSGIDARIVLEQINSAKKNYL